MITILKMATFKIIIKRFIWINWHKNVIAIFHLRTISVAIVLYICSVSCENCTVHSFGHIVWIDCGWVGVYMLFVPVSMLNINKQRFVRCV